VTVYVDRILKYPSGQWCHLFTDGYLTELFDLALKIGLKMSWFQYELNCTMPHFDLRPSMRVKAIKAGAVAVEREKMAEVVNLWRKRRGLK